MRGIYTIEPILDDHLSGQQSGWKCVAGHKRGLCYFLPVFMWARFVGWYEGVIVQDTGHP